MTAADLEKLSDSELDRMAAERVMGWKKSHVYVHPKGIIRWYAGIHKDADNLGNIYTGDLAGDPWSPSTDIANAFTLQAEIERKGRQEKFAYFLNYLVGIRNEWHVANASARNRTIAAILAVENA